MKLHIKIASWFGRNEHFFGILIGILLASKIYDDSMVSLEFIFIAWLIYFVSHRLEKFFYMGKGNRSLFNN